MPWEHSFAENRLILFLDVVKDYSGLIPKKSLVFEVC
jgi:hypothetical protein